MSQSGTRRTPWEMVDVLILTASRGEYDAVLEVDAGALPGSAWERRPGPVGLEVALRTFQAEWGGTLRVAVGRVLDGGGVAPAYAAAPFVRAYSPRCLAAGGVCVVREGAVEPGSVIIADRLWSPDTGQPRMERLPYRISARWERAAQGFSSKTWRGSIVAASKTGKEPESLDQCSEERSGPPGVEVGDSVLSALAHRRDIPYLLVVKGVVVGAGQTQRSMAARAAAETLLAFVRMQLPSMQSLGGHIPGARAGVDALLGPGTREPPKGRGPMALLDAQYRFVDFFEPIRSQLLQDLQAWCEEDTPVSVRLFHGASGTGKTRSFIEWCGQRRGQGWRAGFLEEVVDPDRFEALVAASSERPTLVVIDRAESHPGLAALLQSVTHRRKAGGPGRLRVALIAREVGGWWEILQRRSLELRKLLKDRLPTEVGPFAVSDREVVFRQAAERFAALLGRKPPAHLPMALTDPRFDRVLHLHMAALAAVLGLTSTPETLMEDLLDAEGPDWRTWPVGAFAEVVRGWGVGWEPELLGETMVLRALRDKGRSVSQGLRRVLDELDEVGGRSTRNAFEVLGHLSVQAPEAGECIASLLEGAVGSRAIDALEAAKSIGQRPIYAAPGRVLAQALAREGTPEVAEHLDAAGLPEFSAPLREVTAWAKATLLNHRPQGDSPQSRIERARLLGSLARLRNALGQRQEVLPMARETVEHYRKLAEAYPEVFRSELALSLADLGVMLGEQGQREEALASLQEAVALRRVLAEEDPDEFLPSLAINLNGLAGTLSALGRRDEALAAMQEAVGHYGTLSRKFPEMYLPELAASLNNLSSMQGSLGRKPESLDSIREAVGHYRTLAKRHPEAFLPELAGSLTNLAIIKGELGQREDALALVREAVGLYRQRMGALQDEHLPNFAASLNSLASAQSALGQREEALASIQESVAIRRKLAAERPQAFLADLAMSLANLGVFLSELGRREESLAAVQEAADQYRKLAQAYSAAYLPALAICLSNLSAAQSSLGRNEQALASVREAVGYYRKLAMMIPAMFLSHLASSLNNLSSVQSALEQWQESLASAKESVEIRRKLAETQPQAILPYLATSLSNLGTVQSALGQKEEALASLREAVELRRKLAEAQPEVFRADLAMGLGNLGVMQSTLGANEEALASLREAVEQRRALAREHPDAFLPELAQSLTSLGKVQRALGRTEPALAAVREALDIIWPFFLKLPSAFAPLTSTLMREVSAQQEEAGGPPPTSWKERLSTWATMMEKLEAKVH